MISSWFRYILMGFLMMLSTMEKLLMSTIKRYRMVEALKYGMTELNTQVIGKTAFNTDTVKNKIL